MFLTAEMVFTMQTHSWDWSTRLQVKILWNCDLLSVDVKMYILNIFVWHFFFPECSSPTPGPGKEWEEYVQIRSLVEKIRKKQKGECGRLWELVGSYSTNLPYDLFLLTAKREILLWLCKYCAILLCWDKNTSPLDMQLLCTFKCLKCSDEHNHWH